MCLVFLWGELGLLPHCTSKNRSRVPSKVVKPCENLTGWTDIREGEELYISLTSFLPWSKGVGWLNSSDPFFFESALCNKVVLDWIAEV